MPDMEGPGRCFNCDISSSLVRACLEDALLAAGEEEDEEQSDVLSASGASLQSALLSSPFLSASKPGMRDTTRAAAAAGGHSGPAVPVREATLLQPRKDTKLAPTSSSGSSSSPQPGQPPEPHPEPGPSKAEPDAEKNDATSRRRHLEQRLHLPRLELQQQQQPSPRSAAAHRPLAFPPVAPTAVASTPGGSAPSSRPSPQRLLRRPPLAAAAPLQEGHGGLQRDGGGLDCLSPRPSASGQRLFLPYHPLPPMVGTREVLECALDEVTPTIAPAVRLPPLPHTGQRGGDCNSARRSPGELSEERPSSTLPFDAFLAARPLAAPRQPAGQAEPPCPHPPPRPQALPLEARARRRFTPLYVQMQRKYEVHERQHLDAAKERRRDLVVQAVPVHIIAAPRPRAGRLASAPGAKARSKSKAASGGGRRRVRSRRAVSKASGGGSRHSRRAVEKASAKGRAGSKAPASSKARSEVVDAAAPAEANEAPVVL